jgi:multiple sugar transport system ATP-binding protein
MAGIGFRDVHKRYGDVEVIRRLDLAVGEREFMVLVGPSGCGKSTALRMIAGLEQASFGDVIIGDRRVNDVAPKERDVAMVFQSYALYPHMSVRENIAFGLMIRKLDAAEINRRVQEAAQTLGLVEVLDRKPKALSGGQRQRVALGRAMVRRPQVFLFDEPLSNLDAKLRVSMRGEIARLQRSLETTTLYVTHDQTEAMTMGDRIAVFAPIAEAGETTLKQVGCPLDLYDRPQNLFVARFIGSPHMSLFEAVVDETGSQARHTAFTAQAPAGAKPGAKVMLGLRPEDVRRAGDHGWSRPMALSAIVDFVETLGHEVILHCRIGPDIVLAKIHDHTHLPRMGDAIALEANIDKIHYFDTTTERRLERTAS